MQRFPTVGSVVLIKVILTKGAKEREHYENCTAVELT